MNSYNFLYADKKTAIADFSAKEIKEFPVMRINTKNWNIGKEIPTVTLRGCWNEKGFFLFFSVIEKESLRRYKKLNDPVYRDSCVEFFIRPQESEETYCNFEFNSYGTLLSQIGKNRNDRIFITEKEANAIERIANYTDATSETQEAHWSLKIHIPTWVVNNRKIEVVQGKEFFCNFYKCGDDLKDFHFLSWNPVKTPEPDFHRPDFFGTIKLQK